MPILNQYLESLEDLERGDLAAAERATDSLLGLIEAEEVTLVTALPVGGVDFSDDRVEHHNVTFRTLTPEELGHISEMAGGFDPRAPQRRGVFPLEFDPTNERWVLEVRIVSPKDRQPQAGLWPQKFVLALQLGGFEPNGRGQAMTWTEPSPPIFSGFQRFRLPRRTDTSQCTVDDLAEAAVTADRIPDDAFGQPTSRTSVALHRFQLGAAEDAAADALLDYVIAQEAMLLPERFEGELRFRLALFGAHFLGQTEAERTDLFRKLRGIYDARSDVVHGKMPSPTALGNAASSARVLTGRMLVKGLHEGWPSQEHLTQLALGSPPAASAES